MSVPVGIMKRVVKRAFEDTSADDVMSMSAALAFYTALSLAPLVVLVLTIGGLIWTGTDVRQELVRQATGLVGKSGGEVVETILRASAKQDQKGSRRSWPSAGSSSGPRPSSPSSSRP